MEKHISGLVTEISRSSSLFLDTKLAFERLKLPLCFLQKATYEIKMLQHNINSNFHLRKKK